MRNIQAYRTDAEPVLIRTAFLGRRRCDLVWLFPRMK
jgi:hypothetical protein